MQVDNKVGLHLFFIIYIGAKFAGASDIDISMYVSSMRQVYLYGDKHHHLIEYIEHMNNPNKQ